MKTLHLLIPEWHGCGGDNRVAEGAGLLHEAMSPALEFTEIEVSREGRLRLEEGVIGRSTILKNAQLAKEAVETARPERIFLIGGTCGSELIPVSYLNQRYRSDLAVLWLDAHGDLNTPESSPSGHFHGMILRTLLGDGDSDLLRFVPVSLNPEQVTLLGTRDLDPPEEEYLGRKGIPALPPNCVSDEAIVMEALRRSGASNIYIHFDLDFLDPADFPSVLVPTAGGVSIDELEPILRSIAEAFNVVGFSVVEFVPTHPELANRIAALFQNSGITMHFNERRSIGDSSLLW